MKRIYSPISFLLTCLWNMLIRYRWLLLIFGLLALHFLFGVPLWLFWLALGLWVVYIVLMALFVKFANYCGNLPVVQKPNRNPYSASDAEVFSAVGHRESEERQEQQS